MKGNAYFVSHGGAAFPDLDLVLEDRAVTIILVGNTDITNGITTTTFATTPDVPVSSVKVSLPAKSNSAVSGFGDLCHKPLTMPTTITGQNGKVTKLNTVISVTGCGVKVVGKKVPGNTAILTVQTFAAGRISGSGSWPSSGSKRSNGLVKQVARNLSQAYKSVTLKVPLANKGKNKSKPLKVRIRVGFLPKKKRSALAGIHDGRLPLEACTAKARGWGASSAPPAASAARAEHSGLEKDVTAAARCPRLQ